jgi:hypothetical protein
VTVRIPDGATLSSMTQVVLTNLDGQSDARSDLFQP